MASLSYLQPHIDAIHAKAEAYDVPTPVIDALQDLFKGMLSWCSPDLFDTVCSSQHTKDILPLHPTQYNN